MLIDVHCHLNLFLTIDKIVEEAQMSGVEKIIAVAMSAKSQKQILEISKYYDSIYPALGIHPEEVNQNPNIDKDLDDIIEFIKKNKEKICAIGEIGLDHYFVKKKELYPLQKIIFEKMLSLAQELELPVNLHTKGAEKEVFTILPSYNLPNINIHWYSGPESYLKEGIDRGYYFSITPAIKYSTAVKNVAIKVNNDRLLLESDGPVKYSGKIGTPAMIKDTLTIISNVKRIQESDLEQQIMKNTMKVFPKIFQ
ncbi:MAG: TatD family hydrolase [Promethearchaeota archaeon]